MPVLNKFPTVSAPYRIAFVGEAPGKDEESQGLPFVGASGRLFNALLSKANILREACFIGNVCQIRPPDNVIASFDYDGVAIQNGMTQLTKDLLEFKPNLIVPLGNLALHFCKEPWTMLKKGRAEGKLKFKYPNSIENWRGSKFFSQHGEDLGVQDVKCLAALHPAYCLRNFENTPLLAMDLKRAYDEGRSSGLSLPQRILYTDINADEICTWVSRIRNTKHAIALDIEGYWSGVSCISISTDSAFSFIIPFFKKDNSSFFSEEDEVKVTRSLAELLSDADVPKTWQNGLYDRFVLQYGFRMPVLGNADDTMVKWWEKYCELPKGLDTQMSILTEEPFYKGDRKSQDDKTFYEYCCKDSAVTFEINTKLDNLVDSHSPKANEHYRFNHSLLNLFLYIELRGIRYDSDLAKQRLKEVDTYLYILQTKLDRIAGVGIDGLEPVLEKVIRIVMCYVKDRTKVKAEYTNVFDDCLKITTSLSPLSDEERGFLSVHLGLDMNIKSIRFKEYLYDYLKLPEQFSKEGVRTTDALALLKLLHKSPHEAVKIASEIALLRTRTQFLHITSDPDGRIRAGYNVVGTNTGRISCYTSPTGSGYNLQTLPDEDTTKEVSHPLRHGMRDLVTADIGHYFFKCDLKGADGWTVGAHLNRLGDSTMLDDLRFGIKPAARMCYLLRHGVYALKGKTREEIKDLLKEIKGSDWDYFACKVGIWGICYTMGPDKLSEQIFEESDGKILLSRKDATEFKATVFEGYKIKLWHDWMMRTLKRDPRLTAASGHCRRFYGREGENLGDALAYEPQANTTYATNMAASKLWNDPENRTKRYHIDEKGDSIEIPFHIEPLHQMHDELDGQFLIEQSAWSVEKIKGYFNNPMVIAGQSITIPFSGSYGPSWGKRPFEF